jgi:hypothetical protein
MRDQCIQTILLVFVFAISGFLGSCTDRIRYPTEPGGGGRHLKSPDGRFEAFASNLAQDISPDVTRSFYQFTIRDKNRKIIAEHEIDEPQKNMIMFREGTGQIYWSADSSSVRFGTQSTTLWHWQAPK